MNAGFRCVLSTQMEPKKKLITNTPISMPAGVSGYSAIWSPNKTHLAFVKLDGTNKNVIGLYVIDQGGNNEVLIMKGSVYHAQWSPDSMRIAFTVLLGPGNDKPRIYVTNADGSNQIQLTNSNSMYPAWSPDGKKIAFTSTERNKIGIWVVNLDGPGLTQLTDSGSEPSWSPDGQYIVYAKGNPWCFLCPDSTQLWIMKADGLQQTFITNGPAHNPAWQPAP